MTEKLSHIVFDNVMENEEFAKAKKEALALDYPDTVYKGVPLFGVNMEGPDLTHLLERCMGEDGQVITVQEQAYRRNTSKTKDLEGWIHEDTGTGSALTAVFYFEPEDMGPATGTCFWEWRGDLSKDEDGFARAKDSAESSQSEIKATIKWKLRDLVPGIPNRLLVFPSSRYHSRWPKSLPWKTRRTVWVCFFTIEGLGQS